MLSWISSHWLETLVIVGLGGSTLIQIAPIKVNPWSWLAKRIGKAINGEMIEANKRLAGSVEALRDDLSKHIAVDDERHIRQCRMRILRFSDEILQGKRHTKEHFDELLDDITEYNNYCNRHENFENSKAVLAIRNIEETYMKCQTDKSFL